MSIIDDFNGYDWSHHQPISGGYARSLCETLKHLISAEGQEREIVERDISGGVFPNYPSSIPAIISLLFKMVSDPNVTNRWSILELISYPMWYSEECTELMAQGQDELKDEITKVFHLGKPIYIQCLAHADPRMRQAAASALALIKDEESFDTFPATSC